MGPLYPGIGALPFLYPGASSKHIHPQCACSLYAVLCCGSTCRSGFQSESGLHTSSGPNPFFRAIDGALTVRTQRSPYPLNSLGAIGAAAACCACARFPSYYFLPSSPPTSTSGLDSTSHYPFQPHHSFHKALGQPAATCSVLTDDSSPPSHRLAANPVHLDDHHHHHYYPLVRHTTIFAPPFLCYYYYSPVFFRRDDLPTRFGAVSNFYIQQ